MSKTNQLILTPHPLLMDGQQQMVWEAHAGDSLYAILTKNIPEIDGQEWIVSIGGVPVERHLWHMVKPKQGQVIEVRGGVGRAALQIVAMVALTYFTFGLGTAAAGAWGAGAAAGAFGGGAAGALFATGAFMAGSMLINKVLGPKIPKAQSQSTDSVYNISGARNRVRAYESVPILFGRTRIAPDVLSKPYTWYESNIQYLGVMLCSGINVGRCEQVYNGDTPLSNYSGTAVFHAGYSEMADQVIPLYSNVDTVDGAVLDTATGWVQRTTSANTVRIQINIEYVLGGTGTSGKSYFVSETVVSEYRPVGTSTWLPLASQTFRSEKFDPLRATLSRDVADGQYEVRARILGTGDYSGKNTQRNDFQWTNMASVQADTADYAGLARTGVRMQATDQLNGQPDELRMVVHSSPCPVWNGLTFVNQETSNPGAHILKYARGFYDGGGNLIAGIGLSDEQIDIEGLKAFMMHCASNGYTYDFWAMDVRSHDDFVSSIARAGFGELSWAGGKLGVVWAAQDQPISAVANMAIMKKGTFQVDYNLANAADGIEYTYVDGDTWETKTLSVPSPGVTTMLNPAQVQGEGVTTEQHAARMARWHLAQSLYQYKDITFSTDLEHMSYQRLSLLSVSHDMTQWGYGGRVIGVSLNSGVVEVELDAEVPAMFGGPAFIGLRIPGERVYRIFQVRPFTGEPVSRVQLVEAWPAGVPMPGDIASNPAHDTLWCYDFKATPGYRVRVTSIQPESDLKGASITCVPEGPEFWTYVLSGEYIPPANNSLLKTRPTASGVTVYETQVDQGNTVFTQLTVNFSIDGPCGNIVILANGVGGEVVEVAQTQTRTATFRIAGPDTYTISVRPYSPEGSLGVPATVTYSTVEAGAPPVLVDIFDVIEKEGGLRQYIWGWLDDTIRSPDFAGVEIRYTAGNVTSPDWETMTPLGESGYYTAPFESVLPPAGDWTIACRSRNTAGLLSDEMRTVSRTFGPNLGELIDGIDGTIDQALGDLIALQQAIDQETYDRIAADLNVATAAGADATAKANAARDDALAAVAQVNDQVTQLTSQVDVISGQIGDIAGADLWSVGKSYPAGDHVKYDGKLYRALQPSVGMQPDINPAYWQWVGDYSSVGEAVAAALSMSRTNASEIDVQTTRVDGIVVRMPTGTDKLANEARVVAAETAAANANSATANRVGAVEVRMPAGNGELATSAQVASEESARVSGDNALGSRIGVVEGRMPTGTDKLANEARVVTAETAAANATSAVANQVTNLSAKVSSIGRAGDNAIFDGDFEMYADGQVLVDYGPTIGTAVVTAAAAYSGTKSVVLTRGSSQTTNLDLGLPRDGSVIPCNGARTWYVEAMVRRAPGSTVSTGNTRLNLYARVTKTDGNFDWPLFASVTISEVGTNWTKISGRVTTPSDTVGIIGLVTLVAANSQNGAAFMVDSFVMRDVTEAQAVAADLTVVNQARIDGDNALAGQIVTAQSTANGAQSTATTALSTANNAASVASSAQTAAGNAQSTATTALNTANNAASSVATVATRVGGSANLVANSDLSMQLAGWNVSWNPGNWTNPVIDMSGPDWSPPNVKTLGIYRAGTVTAGSYMVVYSDKIPVEGAKWYILSARSANHRCRVRLAVRFSSPTNSNLGEFSTDWITHSVGGNGGKNLENWDYSFLRVQVPAGATDAEVGYWGDGIGEADAYAWFCRPMFEEAGPSQTLPSPYSPGVANTQLASATSALTTSVNSVSGRLSAKQTVALDVNGNVSGTVSENDGVRSSFSILATVFRVISNITGMGMEWQDGYLRIWRGSGQLVMGYNFGPGDLIMWAGPNIGPAACTKANATWWLDTGGNSYFAGQVLQGLLRFFDSSTTLGAGVTVSTGAIPRNGKTVQATARFNHQYSQTYQGFSSTITLGEGSTAAVVAIDRRYGAGAWTELGRLTLGGSDDVVNVNDGPSLITQTITGQVFVSDSATTAATEYRARVVSISRRSHTVINPGTTPAEVTSQYQSIESLE